VPCLSKPFDRAAVLEAIARSEPKG
jgi:hypothetical protein